MKVAHIMIVYSPCKDMILNLKLISYETVKHVLLNDMCHTCNLFFNSDASLGQR